MVRSAVIGIQCAGTPEVPLSRRILPQVVIRLADCQPQSGLGQRLVREPGSQSRGGRIQRLPQCDVSSEPTRLTDRPGSDQYLVLDEPEHCGRLSLRDQGPPLSLFRLGPLPLGPQHPDCGPDHTGGQHSRQRPARYLQHSSPPPLLDDMDLGPGCCQLGLFRPLVGHPPQRRHLAGHRRTVRRSVRRLGCQAPLAQGHDAGIRPAPVQPGQGVRHPAPDRTSPHLLGVSPLERRFPGQEHAQQPAQAEHVRPGIDPVRFPGRLLGGHERRRAQQAAGLG